MRINESRNVGGTQSAGLPSRAESAKKSHDSGALEFTGDLLALSGGFGALLREGDATDAREQLLTQLQQTYLDGHMQVDADALSRLVVNRAFDKHR